jgi:hypothetical protein
MTAPATFEEKLSAICAKELAEGKGDPNRMAAMYERLSNSLGFTICNIAEGDPKRIDDLLAASENYVAEASAEHQKFAAFMARVKHGTAQ